MKLELHKIIINELIKKQGGDPSTFIPENELDIANEKLCGVINTLDDAFSKKTEKRAKFNDDGFKPSIDLLLSNSEEFHSLAKKLTTKLKDIVTGLNFATGGYIIFCLCKKKHAFLSVFIIRNTESTTLQKKDGSWDIDTVVHLDVKNFAMGGKINLSVYSDKDSDERYVSFVRGNTDISQYFENWVGVAEERSEVKDVNSLIQVIERIELPNEFDNTIEFKQAIYNYVKSSGKNIINIRDLSKHFYDDDQKIANYASENDIDLDGEFKVSGRQLNKFYKVSSKFDGISLQAPLNKFTNTDKSIQIIDNKVIIHSKDMANDLQRQINDSNENEF